MTIPNEPISAAPIPPGFPAYTGQPPNGPDDDLTYLPNGMIRFFIHGTEYMLRTPTLGQYRELRDLLAIISEEATAHRKAREEAARKQAEGEMVEPIPLLDQSPKMIGFLRSAFKLLDLSTRSLPTLDEDLPSWFVDPALPGEMLVHWRQRPTPRGGNPR